MVYAPKREGFSCVMGVGGTVLDAYPEQEGVRKKGYAKQIRKKGCAKERCALSHALLLQLNNNPFVSSASMVMYAYGTQMLLQSRQRFSKYGRRGGKFTG